KYVSWTLSKTTKYPGDCGVPGCTPGALVAPNLTNTSLTVPLVPPGSRFMDRLNQLDVGIRRTFAIRERIHVQTQVEMFNVNNAHTVLLETQTLGTSVKPFVAGGLGGTPQALLQPRLLRVALQFKFCRLGYCLEAMRPRPVRRLPVAATSLGRPSCSRSPLFCHWQCGR